MTRLVVLKSPDFAAYAAAHPGTLPYRADRLAADGFELAWDDRRARLTGRVRRIVDRIEGRGTPVVQVWHLRRALRDAPATLAFFESEAHGLALGRVVGWRRRTALVVMSCWLGELAPCLGPWRRRLYRLLYRRVDAVTVFSANQIPALVEHLGIPRAKIHPIPFGIDTDELATRSVTTGDYLLAVGRDAGRDWPTLFAALGGTGQRVLVLTRPSRLDATPPPEVEVLGYVERERYLELLAGCAGVLVVTREMAYPSGQTVLLEALALGKPCVVTDTPAMKAFGDDLPCTWVPVGDVAALRRAVATLDPGAAPVVARERLDAAAMWHEVAGVIRGCLGARG